MAIADQLIPQVQNRINNKQFDHNEETGRSTDFLGNLTAKRLWVSGSTRGSTIEVLDADKPLLKVTLELDWTYKRKQFRGIQPPIEEDRTDTGKYIFLR